MLRLRLGYRNFEEKSIRIVLVKAITSAYSFSCYKKHKSVGIRNRGALMPRIRFNPESILRVVVWKVPSTRECLRCERELEWRRLERECMES